MNNKTNIRKKITSIFTNILLAIIFIISIIYVGARIYGINSYIVVSGSMEPKIHTGSLVFINTRDSYNNIKINDIVAFKNKETQVVHRVIDGNSNDGYITKGDANNADDGTTVINETFIGKEMLAIPYLGYAINFIKKPFVFMFVISFVFILIILRILFRNSIYKDDTEEDKQENTNEEEIDIKK